MTCVKGRQATSHKVNLTVFTSSVFLVAVAAISKKQRQTQQHKSVAIEVVPTRRLQAWLVPVSAGLRCR